jgi:PleD family two-component response regulator
MGSKGSPPKGGSPEQYIRNSETLLPATLKLQMMKPVVSYSQSVLLVDDDEDDCMLLGQALATVSNSFKLSCIWNTDFLFDSISSHKPRLIIIDFHMPKKSGLECVRQIKNHPDYKDIPIVMWSTSAISKNLIESIKGIQHFFQKPANFKELVAELRNVLSSAIIA